MPLKPFQERVIAEKRDLDEKIQKLEAFTRSAQFGELNPAERERMSIQLKAMNDYWRALRDRIAAFSGAVIDVPATDPGGYIGRGAESKPLTPGEAARIEFSAGRNIAREGRELPDHASDSARNGYLYERALIKAARKGSVATVDNAPVERSGQSRVEEPSVT